MKEWKFRLAIAGILIALLMADGAWWSRTYARGDIAGTALQVAPSKVDGELVSLSLVDVQSVESDRYTVRDGVRTLVVLAEPHGLSVGDELYVRGTYSHPEGQIRETWRAVAPQRKGKWALGFLALVITMLGLPIAFRLTPAGVVMRG